MRIALAGNPNSGKTTMYNALTGSNEKVGNWAGVTVDMKHHLIKKSFSGGERIVAVDLPGAYSMSPFTSEESVTSLYIKEQKPDVIVNIVDASNLGRSLFFTTQLLELGVPVVVALNKSDINIKKNIEIDIEVLSKRLMCPVVKTISLSADGLKAVIDAVIKQRGAVQNAPYVDREVDLTDKNAVKVADRKRFEFVNMIVSEVEERKDLTHRLTTSDKIDRLLTGRWLGIPIFAVVMWLVFQISQSWVGPFVADWLSNLLEKFQGFIAELVSTASPILQSILIDGIVGGVIAVIGFLPLVMVMYFLIAILEDCGYMSRVAVVLDPIFKKVGLSGKSVIPLVIGVGCAVPGVMACRTIRDERERRATAMLTPFMPCGAKIPVIALFAGAFFENAGWVSTLMYFMGIAVVFLGALLVNGIVGYRAKKTYFIIELPEYKMPDLVGAFRSMCSRGWDYIVKAGTIILVCNLVVNILQSFTWGFAYLDYNGVIDGAYQKIAELELAGTPLSNAELESFWAVTNARVAEMSSHSILASIAKPFSIVLVPIIGRFAWQMAAATITGFIAKENVVGTLAVCFAIPNLINTGNFEMTGDGTSIAATFGISSVAALAFLMFNLFNPPCFAAIGAMNAELKSAKWLVGSVALQLSVGFTIGVLVYTIGTLIVAPATLNVGAAVGGLVAVAVIVAVVTVLICRARSEKRLGK